MVGNHFVTRGDSRLPVSQPEGVFADELETGVILEADAPEIDAAVLSDGAAIFARLAADAVWIEE